MNSDPEKRDPKSYAVIGAAMEVHTQLHFGFLEGVYSDALEAEFRLRGIPYQREVILPVYYKGVELPCRFRADFICFGDMIVELKAQKILTGIERAQVINYLRATGYQVAILLNFGSTSLEFERIVMTPV